MTIPSSTPSLPAHLRATLARLIEARHGNEPEEEAAGWRGLLEEREGEDGTPYYVATRDIQSEETVFIIDHLWCTTLFSARAQLQAHPVICGNLRYLCGLEDEEEEEEEDEQDVADDGTVSARSWSDDEEDEAIPVLSTDVEVKEFLAQHTDNAELDLDNLLPRRSRRALDLLQALFAGIPRVLPDLQTLSLRDTHLDSTLAPALRTCLQAMPNLKAVYLRGNLGLYDEPQDPFASSILDESMLQERLEVVNRKLTPAYSAWALRYLGEVGCEHENEEEEGVARENEKESENAEDPAATIVALDLSGRQLPLLKPVVFAAAVPRLRRLDLRGNPALIAAAAATSWQDVLLPTLRVLPRLESLWADPLVGGSAGCAGGRHTGVLFKGPSPDAVVGEDGSVTKWEEEVALALPQLRWINGRSITRLLADATTTAIAKARVVLGSEGGRVAEGIDKILLGMWPYVEPMRLAASEEHHAEVYWYAMDLPGQGIGHAFCSFLGPHLAFVPMRDRRLGVTFSVAWPVREIKAGEVVCRDVLADFPFPSSYVFAGGMMVKNEVEDEMRELVLRALWGRRLWKKQRGLARPQQQQQQQQQQTKEELWEQRQQQEQQVEEDLSHADFGGEAAALQENSSPPPPPVFPLSPSTPPPQPLLVFTDMPVVQSTLDLPHLFTFTDDPVEADIIWATPAFFSSPPSYAPASCSFSPQEERKRQWRATVPNLDRVDDKCEMVKLLTHQSHPNDDSSVPSPSLSWLPRTYCLPEDLPALLQEWSKPSSSSSSSSSSTSSSSTWILKPPHLARGWDIVITRSLPCVLRHLQASGRLAVSHYLPSPDMWTDGHKYDLRLYLLLLSPSQVLIHDHFRVRRAPRPYSMALDHLEDLSRHLTNTTLGLEEEGGGEGGGGCPTETVSCQEFVEGWEGLHSGRGWKEVRRRIEGMLAECFGLLAGGGEGGGRRGHEGVCLGHDSYGRALVGVDVLLDRETLSPHLIEINASPNVLGLLSERPSFMNEVFVAAFVEGGGEGGGAGFRPLLG